MKYLKYLIKENTCFKNTENENCSTSFQNSGTYATGWSGFHEMNVSVLKMHFIKLKPNPILHYDYENNSNEIFRADLDTDLWKDDICNMEC